MYHHTIQLKEVSSLLCYYLDNPKAILNFVLLTTLLYEWVEREGLLDYGRVWDTTM
jgi:hypothetical protein